MLDSLQTTFSSLGVSGIFLVMMIENLGIPFPTEVGFLIAQGLITTGHLTYSSAVIIITAGHVVGSLIAYTIGRWGDQKTVHYFARNKRMADVKTRLITWYSKYGGLTVFGSRIFGYVRPWASLVAGFARVPLGPFLLWTSLGSLLFSIVSLSLTNYIVYIWHHYPGLHILMVIIMFCLFFGLLGFELIRQFVRKNKD